MRSFLFGSCSPAGSCAQGMYAIFRVAVGLYMALAHGLAKLPPAGKGFMGAIEALNLPVPIAWGWAVALSEFAGGILIALGLFTRPAAVAVGVTMGVAAFAVHGGDPWAKKELAILYFVSAILIASFGSGKYGADSALRGRS